MQSRIAPSGSSRPGAHVFRTIAGLCIALSLLAADLLASVRKVLPAQQMPPARLFFESATVAELAELVDNTVQESNVPGSAERDRAGLTGEEDR